MSADFIESEDVGAALREGRPLRAAHSYAYLLASNGLDFQAASVVDPVPIGRQILTGCRPHAHDGRVPNRDHGVSAISRTCASTSPSTSASAAPSASSPSSTDRDFKLDPQRATSCAGASRSLAARRSRTLGGVGEDKDIFLKCPGGDEPPDRAQDLVDLATPGVEHFITAPRAIPVWDIIVNSRQEFVRSKHVTFEEIVQLAFPGPARRRTR